MSSTSETAALVRAGRVLLRHMGMQVMGIERDLLVNAWYTGGADVIDFSLRG